VVGRVDGVGVHVQDVLRDREHFVADMGFSETAAPGCVIAARMLPFEGFLMTTGAALLASATVLRRTADTLDVNRLLPEDVRALPEDVWCQLAPMILGACLHSDGTGHITYEDVPGGPGTAGPETGGRVGPNEQRPCGNGRKYKKCCGRR
jgi:hypothetical protein